MGKKIPPAYVLAGRVPIRLKIAPGYSPGTNKFSFGSVEGLLLLTPTTYELVAVVNTRKNNGTFAKFLGHLVALARQHGRDIVVAEIGNLRLRQHLTEKHGYAPLAGGRHAFLAVAGPGTAPPVFTQPAPERPAGIDQLFAFFANNL